MLMLLERFALFWIISPRETFKAEAILPYVDIGGQVWQFSILDIIEEDIPLFSDNAFKVSPDSCLFFFIFCPISLTIPWISSIFFDMNF
jgi:hypothetical protein